MEYFSDLLNARNEFAPSIKSFPISNEDRVYTIGAEQFENYPFLWDLKLPELLSALNTINQCAAEEIRYGDEPPRGPRPKREIEAWVKALFELWTSMGRDFTIDFTKDLEPISPAAVFCCEVTKRLTDEIPARTIKTKMRECQKTAHEPHQEK